MFAILKFIGRHFITIALVVIALIVGGYVVGSVQNVRESLFPQTVATIRSSIIMVNQIKAIAQLVTVSSEVGTTNIDVEIHQGFLNSGYYSASHIAIGAIDAGIDFLKDWRRRHWVAQRSLYHNLARAYHYELSN